MRVSRFPNRTQRHTDIYTEQARRRRECKRILADIKRAKQLMKLLAASDNVSCRPICNRLRNFSRVVLGLRTPRSSTYTIIPDAVTEVKLGMDIDTIVTSLQRHIDNLADVANARQYKHLVKVWFRVVLLLQGLESTPQEQRREVCNALWKLVGILEEHLKKVEICFPSQGDIGTVDQPPPERDIVEALPSNLVTEQFGPWRMSLLPASKRSVHFAVWGKYEEYKELVTRRPRRSEEQAIITVHRITSENLGQILPSHQRKYQGKVWEGTCPLDHHQYEERTDIHGTSKHQNPANQKLKLPTLLADQLQNVTIDAGPLLFRWKIDTTKRSVDHPAKRSNWLAMKRHAKRLNCEVLHVEYSRNNRRSMRVDIGKGEGWREFYPKDQSEQSSAFGYALHGCGDAGPKKTFVERVGRKLKWWKQDMMIYWGSDESAAEG
jgi:hypothetical protein